jgi:diacylglycerol kinase (ATP)
MWSDLGDEAERSRANHETIKLPKSPRALAIISRGALNFSAGKVVEALATLRAHGWVIDEVIANSRGQAEESARKAVAERANVVLAIGGDGTYAAVAGALRGHETMLAPLPAGTANGWAREMGVPLDCLRAAKRLETARIVMVDVGCVRTADGEHAFLATAGVGFDAAVVAGTPRLLKRWLSVGAYAVTSTRTWAAYRGGCIELRAEDVNVQEHALLLSIGNTRAYGGILMMLPAASNTDGLLDVCLFVGQSWGAKVIHMARVMFGRHARARDVHYLRLSEFQVDSTPQLPVQADGDSAGMTPATFTCYHQSLRVLLPR